MILILLFIQVLILTIMFLKLTDYIIYLYSFFTVLSTILVIYILNKKEDPSFKLAWIIPILLVPVFGCIFYLFVEFQYGVKIINKRLELLEEETSIFVKQNADVMDTLYKSNIQVANLARYIERVSKYPIYKNTKIEYFPLGEYKYKRMLEEIKKAEKYIFLEYFIIEEGEMWNTISDLLEEKVKKGVEVRVMYDGMCSIAMLPYNYPEYLKTKGIQCKMFSPIRPALSTHQNNRDHRKILVIDGKVAFNGGINIGDEYINRISKYGHWKDCAVMLEGDAVKSFVIMFLQMWNINEKNPENYAKYICNDINNLNENHGYIMPFGDSPLDEEQVGENVYLDILATAKNYVYIMTPYLIIDSKMIRALTYASKRGIDVRIILPHIPDKKLVFMFTRTYYKDLIESGVKIYEYMPGFIHGKVFVSDDIKAVVGTINLDFRSLYLHFECATFIYKNDIIKKISEDFKETLNKCKLVSLNDCKNTNLLYKIGGSILRIFAPLL